MPFVFTCKHIAHYGMPGSLPREKGFISTSSKPKTISMVAASAKISFGFVQGVIARVPKSVPRGEYWGGGVIFGAMLLFYLPIFYC